MSDRIPTVEARLEEVERALALGSLVTGAIVGGDGTALHGDESESAFASLFSTLHDAFNSARAIRAALPREAIVAKAPEVRK